MKTDKRHLLHVAEQVPFSLSFSEVSDDRVRCDDVDEDRLVRFPANPFNVPQFVTLDDHHQRRFFSSRIRSNRRNLRDSSDDMLMQSRRDVIRMIRDDEDRQALIARMNLIDDLRRHVDEDDCV